MTAFIALYRGDTVIGAQLVAVTADPTLVRDFTTRLVSDDPDEEQKPGLRLVGQDHDEEA